MIISPSILSCDFLNIESELRAFEGGQNLWLHLDIMDGHFVPNMTFGHPIVSKIGKITKIPLDAHLMVTNPLFYIDSFKTYNLHNFTFHFEACDDPLALVTAAKKYYKSVGISIRPKTSLSLLDDELLSSIDLILIMSVEPGFGGQKFIDETYERIRYVKKKMKELGKNIVIQVDGGVNDKNAGLLVEAGANNLVAGSYIFKNPPEDYLKQVDTLRS